MYCLMKTYHLQSSTNSLLIQVNLTDFIKAIRLTIFNPPSSYCFITVVCFSLLGFLFHKKTINYFNHVFSYGFVRVGKHGKKMVKSRNHECFDNCYFTQW